MKKQFKLGIIGCGFMATTIMRGVVLSDFIKEKKIIVSDINDEKLESVHYLGVRTTNNNNFVAENSEYLVLAVRPKNFEAVAKSIEGVRPEKVISVMSGISKSTIKNSLGVGLIKVARCVPNLACSIGSGAIGIDMVDFNKSIDDTEFISNVFNKLGTIVSLEESKLDAVTALSGNSVYSLLFIDSLINAGVKQGLTKDEAKILAVQSLFGTAELVQREEQSLNELIMQACNNGGPSISALKTFEEMGFDNIISKAVESCVERLRENKQ